MHPNVANTANTAILLLGAPRSGTTWLGKIFDSHPDVLYRHEPDVQQPPSPNADPGSVMAEWSTQRSQRSAGKRPFFRKSWQSEPMYWLRSLLAFVLAASTRLPILGQIFTTLTIPDLGRVAAARLVMKSVTWADGAGDFARALPDSRTILILRHPCGQVASVMRGTRRGLFSLREPGTDMPFEEAQTLHFAASKGLDEASFQALPDAAKYAWSWLMFNEAALAALDELPNAHVVVYENLCARPAEITRDLFAFAGLSWHAQTAAFLANSTNRGEATGYYAVLRDSIAAAERWRGQMSPADQQAVRDVVQQSPVARFWPNL